MSGGPINYAAQISGGGYPPPPGGYGVPPPLGRAAFPPPGAPPYGAYQQPGAPSPQYGYAPPGQAAPPGYPSYPSPGAPAPGYAAPAPYGAPAHPRTSPAAAGPSSKVELRFSCTGLPNFDVRSRSDPQVYVFLKTSTPAYPGRPAQHSFVELGRTDVAKDALNPRFVVPVVVEYRFETVQELLIVVVDVDTKLPGAPLTEHDFLGYLETPLGNVVASGRTSAFERQLVMRAPPGLPVKPPVESWANRPGGTLRIEVEELDEAGAKLSAVIRLRAQGLDKKDTFGKSDPFIVLSKARPDGQFVAVHKTEVIKNTLDPRWAPFRIRMDALCNGDPSRLIRFECFDWDKDGTHDLIGIAAAPLNALRANAALELVNPKKQAKSKSYRNSGTLVVESIAFEREYSFLDYVSSGTSIELAVAVDFTASNGDPSDPASLHHRHPDLAAMNEYQRAIMAIASVLEPYDSDRKFLAYGYGAKLPDGTVSHFFPLGMERGPQVDGVRGLMEAYSQCLYRIALHGPTNFAPTISSIASWAMQGSTGSAQLSRYCILLIITDGAITDVDTTIAAIVSASSAPLSIIIVSVGGADFTPMNVLDADGKRLRAGGREAERDIVQFVPFRQFNPNDLAALSAATLKEVPGQFMQYANARKLQPLG